MNDRIVGISNFIDVNSSVVDIGTDHAYLPIYLYDNNISKNILATDVNEGPIEIAKQNIGSRAIKTMKTSGLDGVNDIFDVCVIAGMGGHLISKILDDNIEKFKQAKKIILQPMQHVFELRKYLYEKGFYILKEHVCLENNRFFIILVAVNGQDKLYDFNMFRVKPTGYYEEYCKYLIEKNIKIYNNIPENNEKKLEVKNIIEKLKKLN